jgi:hypothetical protein
MPRNKPAPTRTPAREPIVVTYSELDTFRQCPLKHQLSYVKGWREEAKIGTPLSRGSLWHNAMELHYTWLQRQPEAELWRIRQFIHANLLVDPQTGEQNEDQQLIQWMLEGHHQCYAKDPGWELMEIEQAHRVRLGPPSSRFYLQFKIDLLIREKQSNQLWLVDHKSARDFSRRVEIDIDDQFGLYTWGLRQLGFDVMGTIRSDARTQRNKGPMAMDQRFRRVHTFRTNVELNRIAADAYDCARSAYSGHRVVYSSPAPDRCAWRCQYLQAHLMIRKGFEVDQALVDFGFEQSAIKHREYAVNPLLDLIPR